MQTDITTGAQTRTSAGAFTGTLSVATALTPIPTIRVAITGLTAGLARIAIQDTQNSSEFSDALPAAVFDVKGPVDQVELSITPDMMPSLRVGNTYNQLRAYLLLLTASTVTVYATAE